MSDDLWVTASTDLASEDLERRITGARLAATPVWPFLAEATSPPEYANRLALMADRIEHVASNAAGGDPVLFGVIHTALLGEFAADFEMLDASREPEREAARRVAAQKASKVAAEGQWIAEFAGQGEDVWSRNSSVYASREEAEVAGRRILRNWFGADMLRVVSADTPAREKISTSDSAIVVNHRTGSRRTASATCPKCGSNNVGVMPIPSYMPGNGRRFNGSSDGDLIDCEACGQRTYVSRGASTASKTAGPSVHTYADGFGRWHAEVSIGGNAIGDDSAAEAAAWGAISDEITSRNQNDILTGVRLEQRTSRDGVLTYHYVEDDGREASRRTAGWPAPDPEAMRNLVGTTPMRDTLTGEVIGYDQISPSALYERGPDGDAYRYQPLSLESGGKATARRTAGENPFPPKKDEAETPEVPEEAAEQAVWTCPACQATDAYTQAGKDLQEALEAKEPIKCGACGQIDQSGGAGGVQPPAPQTPPAAPGAAPVKASRRTAADQGPSYDPASVRTLDLESPGYGREFQYTEGYEHGRSGAPYKGYGSRDKAIAYSHGYRHGQADAGKNASRKQAGTLWNGTEKILDSRGFAALLDDAGSVIGEIRKGSGPHSGSFEWRVVAPGGGFSPSLASGWASSFAEAQSLVESGNKTASRRTASDEDGTSDDFNGGAPFGGRLSETDSQAIVARDPNGQETRPTEADFREFEAWVVRQYGLDALQAYYGHEARRRQAYSPSKRLHCDACDHEWSTQNQYALACPNCGAEESVRKAAGSGLPFGGRTASSPEEVQAFHDGEAYARKAGYSIRDAKSFAQWWRGNVKTPGLSIADGFEQWKPSSPDRFSSRTALTHDEFSRMSPTERRDWMRSATPADRAEMFGEHHEPVLPARDNGNWRSQGYEWNPGYSGPGGESRDQFYDDYYREPAGMDSYGSRRHAAGTQWYVARSAPETRRGFVDVAGPFASQAEAEGAKPEGDGYTVWADLSASDQVAYERFMTSSRQANSYQPTENPYLNDPPVQPGVPDEALDGPVDNPIVHTPMPTSTRPRQQPNGAPSAYSTQPAPASTTTAPAAPATDQVTATAGFVSQSMPHLVQER